jgi:D-sedoheptulose 7-phosphate isomerase
MDFFKNYFSLIDKGANSINTERLRDIAHLIIKAKETNNKLIFVGNGGSAAIASHLTVDFINAANIRAINFNDSSILTCFSNDYGYENWVSKALECYAEPGDLLFLISSSGQSKNMIIGANKAASMSLNVVTLSGFSSDNPLKKLGGANLWLDSDVYNVIEMTHHIWLLAIVDYIIELKKI